MGSEWRGVLDTSSVCIGMGVKSTPSLCLPLAVPAMMLQDSAGKSPFLVEEHGFSWVDGGEPPEGNVI